MYPIDHEIIYDAEYAEELSRKLRTRFGSSTVRTATHVSDLLFCLRKAWARIRIARETGETLDEPSDDQLLTWAMGLQFEELISEGEQQGALAYCFRCRTVNRPPSVPYGEPEVDRCTICGDRWLVGTLDYLVNGIVHEVKATRKSRKKGPQEAPWYVEQLRSYLLFLRLSGRTDASWGRLVVEWINGSYGERTKGRRPIAPLAAMDPFKVIFKEGFEEAWLTELSRRKSIVEAENMPPLWGMGDGDERVPAYDWECASCPVGLAIRCENYTWDEDGNALSDVKEDAAYEVDQV